jgi:predicted transcriptional regulator
MRTTVTLDADVAAKLRALARRRGISFKQVLNQAVRAGPTDRAFEVVLGWVTHICARR